MKVLVIGASGRLGSSVMHELRMRRIPCAGTYCTRENRYATIPFDLFTHTPKILLSKKRIAHTTHVIFAAHVERQKDPDELKVAMKRLIAACGARTFVYISSDAVFDGEKGYYREEDRPFPMHCYGRNLRICEMVVGKAGSQNLVVRPSYLFGYIHGTSDLDPRIASCMKAMRQKMRWPCYHDMYRSPLSYAQAAGVVCELILRGATGIIHAAGPRVSTYEFFAQAMRALTVPDAWLAPGPMPDSVHGVTLIQDSSLDYSRMVALTGIEPLSVYDVLANPRRCDAHAGEIGV